MFLFFPKLSSVLIHIRIRVQYILVYGHRCDKHKIISSGNFTNKYICVKLCVNTLNLKKMLLIMGQATNCQQSTMVVEVTILLCYWPGLCRRDVS